MKKKVDARIRQTLQDAVKNNHRSLVVLVGDKGRDQVVNLHYMLSKMSLKARPSVLWCYRNALGFSSNRKKRMRIIRKRVKQGLVDPNKDDPFELFVSSTTIRFAFYSESQKILGNTFGMCVLQDFEALTPNLLARTFETVQGGGLIVLLINKMASLKQLFSLSMDVHSRLRTEAHHKVVGRFNERFILSMADCRAAIIADDELNVLPISSHVRSLTGATPAPSTSNLAPAVVAGVSTDAAPELKELQQSLVDTQPIGPLIANAKTIDQAKALLRFEEALSEKALRSTVALTASRGRGKSAALGLAVVSALAHDYSNIFVTSPSPENLRTFFEFVVRGFDALGYQKHTDYELIESNDPALHKAVVRVNVFRNHRQTVQYVDPTHAARSLSQAELVVIDEAAAIPLPLVEAMLGPYVVFMCSTVTGYEGTGRSLSLKLIKKLRDGTSRPTLSNGTVLPAKSSSASYSGSGRVFREVQMETPIRYSENDPIERWLYDLLCLEAGGKRQVLTGGAPHPDQCELYYVERDALFSRHRASEAFLHRVMALFVSSHYKNSPNDLQMLSDAPAHSLFVLLAPTRPDTAKLPDVLCAIQVCLEGRISAKSSKTSLSRGQRASGDLIPWTISQQFQEPDFATLSGARIVRIATHPDVQKMGYGTRAMKLLFEYFSKKHAPLGGKISANGRAAGKDRGGDDDDEEHDVGSTSSKSKLSSKGKTLLNEIIGPRKNIPPLLLRLHEREPEELDYMGVSFGATHGLYNFWSRLGFRPLYMRLTPNELTGEHTCIMVCCDVSKAGAEDDEGEHAWLETFYQDFRKRFVSLLGYELRGLKPGLAMAILGSAREEEDGDEMEVARNALRVVQGQFSPYDRRRLESYARSMVDYHVVMDMLPKLAEMYAMGVFGTGLRLSPAQTAILMALGLQRKSVEDLRGDLEIEVSQILALFNKVVRKIAAFVREIEEGELEEGIGKSTGKGVEAVKIVSKVARRMENAHSGEGRKEEEEEQEEQDGGKEEDEEQGGALRRFKVGGSESEWKQALGNGNADVPGVVSVKVKKKRRVEKDDGGDAGSAGKSGKKKRKKLKAVVAA